MSRLKGSSFFCEDLRIEQSGQPIFIGVLSPSFELTDPEGTIDRLFFVSLFYPTIEHADIVIKLTIEISQEDGSDTIVKGPFFRPLGDEVIEEEPGSLMVASLPLDGFPIKLGTAIKAKIEFGDEREEYDLKVQLLDTDD